MNNAVHHWTAKWLCYNAPRNLGWKLVGNFSICVSFEQVRKKPSRTGYCVQKVVCHRYFLHTAYIHQCFSIRLPISNSSLINSITSANKTCILSNKLNGNASPKMWNTGTFYSLLLYMISTWICYLITDHYFTETYLTKITLQ